MDETNHVEIIKKLITNFTDAEKKELIKYMIGTMRPPPIMCHTHYKSSIHAIRPFSNLVSFK